MFLVEVLNFQTSPPGFFKRIFVMFLPTYMKGMSRSMAKLLSQDLDHLDAQEISHLKQKLDEQNAMLGGPP